MSSLDQALAEDSAPTQQSTGSPILDAINEDMQASPQPKTVAQKPVAGPSKAARVATGLGDTEYGLGQLAEHVPVLNTITKGWRMLIQEGLKGAGFGHASELFDPANQGDPTSGDLTDQKAAANFDGIVQKREQDYQAARSAAGQTGIDWWRLGGQAANPVNYLGPGRAASGVAGRISQGAAQGALINAEQPNVNSASYQNPETPGSYWWDKAKGMTTGAFAGGATSGLIEAASTAMNLAKKYLGNGAADTAAAESVVNDALRAKGVDPDSMDLNLLSGMKHEVQDALKSGADDISPESIVNRAKAESLPVPVRLMRGQSTGDPMLYSTEQNLRGINGVGEPITQRLQEQNAAFIQNLDALGAKDAPDTVSAGTALSGKIQQFWDGLQQKKTQLYDAVKNSQGLSAKVDGQSAGQEIRETLGSPQAFHAWMTLPAHIQQTIREMESGDLDLTVSNIQALDKSWGADAAAAEGSAAHAINQARAILGKADISDDVGQDAMKAYQAAKQAHASQMSLLEPKLLNGMPNPNFQPLVKSVVQDGKTDNLFQTGFLGSAPSVGAKNLKFLAENIDPEAPQLVGKTLMGEIKRQALSSASDERGTVSQSVLAGWARDPVKSARLEALMPNPAVQTFKNLADTVEVAKRFPVASTVNTSNTGSAVVNAVGSALKSNAVAQITKRLPIIKQIAEPISDGMKQAGAQTAVKGALNPGVTLKSLMTGTAKQAAGKRTLSRLVTPAAVAAYTADKNKPTPPEQ